MTKSLPATFTNLVEVGDHLIVYEFPSFSSKDAIELGGATLEMEWAGTLRFHQPATWTHEEARSGLVTMLSNMARARCMAIIAGLPDEVVTSVAPQLEEIAEYETKMAAIRREAVGPDIKERWISLPVGR
ncbi:MAG: hypothetical protein HYX53_03295 [Chloroflexi bacterium]|nr:hypothetical protein [Chloroflexota bacterium]